MYIQLTEIVVAIYSRFQIRRGLMLVGSSWRLALH